MVAFQLKVQGISIKEGKRILTKNVKLCNTPFSRIMGLMFRFSLKKNRGFLLRIEKESKIGTSIHMFFVFFPIEAIWISQKKVVLEKKALRPFSFPYTPRKSAQYVLEVPQGDGLLYYKGQKLKFL